MTINNLQSSLNKARIKICSKARCDSKYAEITGKLVPFI